MNSCAADSECTVIFPGCPLGCFVRPSRSPAQGDRGQGAKDAHRVQWRRHRVRVQLRRQQPGCLHRKALHLQPGARAMSSPPVILLTALLCTGGACADDADGIANPSPAPLDARNDLAKDSGAGDGHRSGIERYFHDTSALETSDAVTDSVSQDCFSLSEQACVSNPGCTRIRGLSPGGFLRRPGSPRPHFQGLCLRRAGRRRRRHLGS